MADLYSRKTILYVGGFELPDGNAAAIRVRANTQILAALGYKVVLVGISHRYDESESIRSIEAVSGAYACWERAYPSGARDWLKRALSSNDLENLVSRNYPNDLAAVICYDFPAIAQVRLAAWARKRGAVAIGELTEWYSGNLRWSFVDVARNLDRTLRMRWASQNMDGLIVTSPFLERYYISPKRPCVVLPTLMPDEAPAPATSDPIFRPKRLFFAGTGMDPMSLRHTKTGPKDRLDYIIDVLCAAKKHGPTFVLDVYGVDRNDYIEAMPRQINVLEELGEAVKFHGRKRRNELLEALQVADFGVFFRSDTIVTRAGFPTKFAESVHFGTPVITNITETLAAFFVEGQTGFHIELGDVEAAGKRMAEILSIPNDSVQEMKRQCHAGGAFRPDRFNLKMTDFFSRISETAK